MKKTLLLIFVLVLCTLVILSGCGKSDNKASIEQSDSTSVSETNFDSGNNQQTIYFNLNETVKYEGLCEMSGLYAEVLDDKSKEDGWSYYYTDTDQSPAKMITWEPSKGNYTTLEVFFTAKNISDKPTTFSDKITAQMFYQVNKDANTDYFNGVVFQQNPNQVDENGEVMMWSTKPVEIAPNESTNVSFRFDIPKEIYDKVYATAKGENTGIVETCEFNFGDGKIFVIDLAKSLIASSDYEL